MANRGRAALGLTLAVAVAVAALIGGTALGGRSAGSAGGSGSGRPVAPTGLELATDLIGVEQRDAKVVMFRARTSTDTYWMLGQVTVWDGDGWGPDAATVAALESSARPPGHPAPVLGTTGSRAQVTMAGLTTRLLPAPPGTVSIDPTDRGSVTAVGVVGPRPSQPGERYQTTSEQAPSGTDLVSAAAATSDPGVGLDAAERTQDTNVPVDQHALQALAAQITAGTTTALERAEALVNYFRSGRFHYQIDVPAPVAGTDPVLDFLNTTRTGNCQTFAAAFTLLARSMGLPTRVAIGFTGGTRAPDGSTVVRGSDAHAWPQVHLAAAGWVSFEPTPQLPGNELSPPDVVTRTPISTPTTVAPTTTAVTTPTSGALPPPTGPNGSASTTTTTAPATTTTGAVPSTTIATAPGTRGASGPSWWASLAAALAVLALGLAGWLVWTRRWRQTPAGPSPDPVVAAYERATAPLAGSALARRSAQSPSAHARQVRSQLGGAPVADPDPLAAAMDDLVRLARLAEAAVYGPYPVSPDDAAWAEAAATRIAVVIDQPASRARPDHSAERELSGARPG